VTDEELAKVLNISENQICYLLSRGDAAKLKMISANILLVQHIANKFRYRGVSHQDLVHEGVCGLIKAVEKYDPERGFRFSTYAYWWIRQSISRAIAEKSRIVRLPVHIHEMAVSVHRAEKQFLATHSRKPTPQELANRLGLPISKIEFVLLNDRKVFSGEDEIYIDDDIQVKDRIPSDNMEPGSTSERTVLRANLRDAMRSLSDREAQVIDSRFGLNGNHPLTLNEVGRTLGITKERVRQIEEKAIFKMRNQHLDVIF